MPGRTSPDLTDAMVAVSLSSYRLFEEVADTQRALLLPAGGQ
jgi:hypothetical protein